MGVLKIDTNHRELKPLSCVYISISQRGAKEPV